MTLRDDILAQARALGFHRVGITGAHELGEDHDRYLAFLDAGMHGSMQYLAENRDARRALDHPMILPGARSVVVCALAYHRDERGAGADRPHGDTSGRGGSDGLTGEAVIARYARGGDYHNFFRKSLRKLASWIRETVPGAEARPMVDTAPVLERAWAQRAGVGFVGKNGCVIAPGLGSYVLLGEVATTLELVPDEPLASRCGSCTLCLHACPTGAFVRPFVLDARRCVSYLTIESREAMPLELREGVGDRLFGCDDCQQVCPYNRTAPPAPESTARFATDARWRATDLATLLRQDDAAFRARTLGTPLARPGRAGLARNAATVMGNSGRRRYLPVLREAATEDPDAVVREAARWAIDALEKKGGRGR